MKNKFLQWIAGFFNKTEEPTKIEGQWSLEQCVDHALRALTDETTREAVRTGDWYTSMEFGRWIRNTCGLWEHGTDRCVADIVREYNEGNLISDYLDDNVFHHKGLAFSLENTSSETGADSSLGHPDNCSAVIMEIIVQRLNNDR